ncbi:MAG TPA: ATP-binding cassette domain-containing protein [Afifellaceae bacterium]|nr:ATP-binding cassette domain-containing protein [Afifellaceae bacterium]
MTRADALPALPVRIRRKAFRSSDGTEVPVLRDVAFELAAHQFTCLVGPSGCGKTTTLRILLGLDTDYEGEIDPAFATCRIAAVFQEPRLLPWRTVEQNIRLALPEELRHRSLDRLLADVGLAEMNDRFPSELSLGMARRVALARAFAVDPDILILDEPFVSLDETTAVRLRRLLIDLWRSNPVTVLMVTHNIREAVVLADRIVIMSQRPAHVLGTSEIALPRAERSVDEVETLGRRLAGRFPEIVTM